MSVESVCERSLRKEGKLCPDKGRDAGAVRKQSLADVVINASQHLICFSGCYFCVFFSLSKLGIGCHMITHTHTHTLSF